MIRRGEWVAGIAQGLNVVKVSVADVRVEHEVRLMDFTQWLDRAGGSPREVSDRQRIRSILGMAVSRTSLVCDYERVRTFRTLAEEVAKRNDKAVRPFALHVAAHLPDALGAV